jgi:hypothetical protein
MRAVFGDPVNGYDSRYRKSSYYLQGPASSILNRDYNREF